MAYYTFLFLDDRDFCVRREACEADDDASALSLALFNYRPENREIWQNARIVATLRPGDEPRNINRSLP
jgi:hypothetical protein